MKTCLKNLIVLVLLNVGFNTSANIYKWTDKNGKVYYSDKPPAQMDVQVIDEGELASRYSSYKQVSIESIPFNVAKHHNLGKLVIYTTTHCPYCTKARQYFSKNKIAYKEKNIETSEKYAKEFARFGGKGVPVLFWGKKKMNGFSIKGFEAFYRER